MIQHIATRTRDVFVFGSDFGHWYRVFDGTFEYFDERFAFCLRKLMIERSIGTRGLLNVWIF